MTTRTAAELAIMSPEEIAAWREQELVNVYGAGFKRGRDGKPIEQGIGSIDNPSENSFKSLEKYEGKAAADAARQRANRRLGMERF